MPIPTSTWLLWADGPRGAAANMAIDKSLMDHVASSKQPVLRVYRWVQPAISLGYFQSPEAVLNLERCAQDGIEVVSRFTGGRAVFHGDEYTYCLVFPLDHPLLAGGINKTYHDISSCLLAGIEHLGAEGCRLAAGNMQRASRYRKSRDCYRSTARYELVWQGRKLVGSAQRRRGRVALQHGSIPIGTDVCRLAAYLLRAEGPSGGAAASLSQILGKGVDAPEFVAALAAGFSKFLGVSWQLFEPEAVLLLKS